MQRKQIINVHTANQIFIADDNTPITFLANQYNGTGTTDYNEIVHTPLSKSMLILVMRPKHVTRLIQFSPILGIG